ncbi:MAG: oligosaccharide flippase family protein [Gemmatimonadetes bacterium]|nr:oligosaccharide flippase family protein [Gemmatimonadota bacterium]
MLKSIGSTWGLTLVTIAVTYVLMPFTLRVLGHDGYGTWLLIGSLTGYLNLLMLGVPMASVRQFAASVGRDDPRELNAAIASCTGLFLVMGAVALLSGLALYAFFTSVYPLPGALARDARGAFLLVVVQLSTGFVMQVPYGLLAAKHEFVRRNAISSVAILARLALTLLLLPVVPDLLALAAIQFAAALVEFLASCWLIFRRFPEIRLDLSLFDRGMVRTIFAFSAFVLLLNVAAQLTFQSDAAVIGRFIGIDQIPYYGIGNSLVVNLMQFVLAIAGVVMPMAARFSATGEIPEVREIFLKWSKVAMSITLLAGVFLIVAGPDFVAWWIGPSFREPTGRVLRILMWSSLVFLPARGVALPVLMGMGRPKWPAITFLVAGVVNLLLSIALARPLGLEGVALGTALPNVASAVVIVVMACRALDLPLGEYVRHVVLRPLVGSLPAFAILWWIARQVNLATLPALALSGAAMLVVFGAAWAGFVYRGDPHFAAMVRERWPGAARS